MLRTGRAFRLRDTDCAICQANIGQNNMFPPPVTVTFDAVRDRLCDSYIVQDIDDVRRVYRDIVRKQITLWLVIIFGAIFTCAGMLLVSKWVVIPYIAICGLFGDYILCWPDGMAYDCEHNVLYVEGYFMMHEYPEIVMYVRGSRRFK